MAIEKNSFKVARFDLEFQSPHSRETHTPMSSDDDADFQRNPGAPAVESDDDDDDEFDDCDSGAGSDDFDLLELGESGEEFCQVGDQTCSIPYELYDLPGLKDVLSMEVWNESLTEEERFGLSKYLPDMDQENFMCTLKELFSGDNLHFGSPVDKLFEMLKGGLCEPRVALYKKGLNFFQRKQHYHTLQLHHNGLVNNICQIRDAWMNCRGYSIEEKLRVLNIMRSQKSLMNENMEEFQSDSSNREESADGLRDKRLKDSKLVQKTGRHSVHSIGPASDISSRTRKTKSNMESAKFEKRFPRGTLKLGGSKTTSGRELAEPFSSTHPGRYGLGLPDSHYNIDSGRDPSAAVGKNEQVLEYDDEEDTMVEVAVHRDRNLHRVGVNDKSIASKWKKHEEDKDSFMQSHMSGRNNLHALGRNRAINKLSDIKVLTAKPSNARNMYDSGKKVKYSENHQLFTAENQMKLGKGQKLHSSLKGSQMELLDANDPVWLKHEGIFPTTDLNSRNKKWKMSREGIDLNANNKFLPTEFRARPSQDKFRGSSQNGKRDGVGNRVGLFSKAEDTESDSSEPMDEDDDDDDDNPLMRSKWAYPGGVPELRLGSDAKKSQFSERDEKERYPMGDGSSHSRMMQDYSHALDMMRSEQKGKMHDVTHFNMLPKDLDKYYYPGGIGTGEQHQIHSLGRNGHVEGTRGDNFQAQLKSSLVLGRRRKGEVPHDFSHLQSNYMQGHQFETDLFWTRPPGASNGLPFKLGKKGHLVDLSASHHPERSDIALLGCNALSKKRKVKDDLTYLELQENNHFLHADAEPQLDDVSSSRKRGKHKLEEASDSLENGVPQPPVMEMEVEDIEAETKRPKKSFPLITPTVHNGFSFSVIHLLSAVRMAMVTLFPEDSSETGKHPDKTDAEQGVKEEQSSKQEDAIANSNPSMGVDASMPLLSLANVPFLTVQEIVNHVKSNPGDPCILETQEPLQDLIRGVLKIFSSRTAPLGAKGWKPLVVYQKSTKSWSWIGPVSHNSSDSEAVEEVTSPDAWGLPHKMLVKVVDSFANWLKNSQETLQQIGSLPDPPLTLMQMNLDEKERFKDLRAQKSLNTIGPSSEEVKAYFQKEEVLRYLIPDRAFSYTAVDGKKSIVAPLRRCGGKPTSKARDHFMLKRDRPPHVTILCLVRDAAARLPGSIGTRADVCTLIRDSQYIVEDVSDAQVNQVVSGALDRLHYERDPCVQFDGERKLWVYLHRDREEEDFEDDGTSSTKKWRRQKKEAAEPSEPGDASVAYSGPVGQPGFDSVSDLNADTLCLDDDKRSEPEYQKGNDQVEDNAEISHGSDPGPAPGMWNGLGQKSNEETKLIFQENSTNEEFDEEAFGGEPPA
ncbi:hypothetical protein SASPL_120147 [Salvia splendens]|uniref:DEUBAD domain-containing protein n=2 Tax=Salvia splendens TaxID=180675 RepID=A0A8X8XTQ6_SALSN|nr:uncharacterized protein LOC121741217 isoform X1 [Salvia splendens]XP_041989853.1 uncharacterized protein LOC121741217 isoform X1 [Salvia splendens]KAG6417950.1 hypothetical protein SASPL_120147 [Salvia splendens]